jgi:hypothetical protein
MLDSGELYFLVIFDLIGKDFLIVEVVHVQQAYFPFPDSHPGTDITFAGN